MPGFAEDPQLLTKEKLKRELVAHKVALPAGEHKKEVYVRLYHRHVAPTGGADFSSDEEDDSATPSLHGAGGGVMSSDGVGTTSDMTSKVEVGGLDVDVSSLSNAELARKIREFGVSPGPIVATTRKLYEKKLLRLLEHGDAAPSTAAAGNSGVNGSLQADRYSDTEEDEDEEEDEMAEVYEQTGEETEKAIQTSFLSPFTTHSTKLSEGLEQRLTAAAASAVPDSLSSCGGTVWQRPSIKQDDRRTASDWEPWFSAKEDFVSVRRQKKLDSLNVSHLVGQFDSKNISPIERSLSKSDSGEGLCELDTAMMQDLKLGGGNDADLFISPSGISATRRRPIRGCAQDGWGGFSPDPASRSSLGLGASPVSRPRGQGPIAGPVHEAAASAGPLAASVPVWARLVAFVVACAFIALVYYAFEENVQLSGPFEGAADAATVAAADGGNDGGGVTMAE
ncbi:lamina-associated polypeptide 2, isoforms beta/gamma-like isoform X7 [Petromyzon marinus]|uniref:Lamina-associated polypeptide 2, isoforms beta/delta/epsilon/gamma-like isoform X9 n=1 Tax=Petromyzon marinus TaxID=7757 RepID=A0AAJ7T4H4_PETMA|nr:lamina-associated polypeptide 2, isoforms beta/delta/epsilon/gamma-like isoform X9 [Petromyzon marinus]